MSRISILFSAIFLGSSSLLFSQGEEVTNNTYPKMTIGSFPSNNPFAVGGLLRVSGSIYATGLTLGGEAGDVAGTHQSHAINTLVEEDALFIGYDTNVEKGFDFYAFGPPGNSADAAFPTRVGNKATLVKRIMTLQRNGIVRIKDQLTVGSKTNGIHLNYTSNPVIVSQGADEGLSFQIIGSTGNTAMGMRLMPNGFVGIGTPTPEQSFHVKSANHFPAIFESTQNQSIIELRTSEGIANRVEFTNRGGGRASIWVSNVPGMKDDITTGVKGNLALGDAFNVLANGNVGIGTTVPNHNLEVAKNIRSEGLLVGTDNLVPGTVLTIDGAVYISSDDDTNPITADDDEYNITSAYLEEYSLWVDDGIVTDDIAIINPTLWSDYVFEDAYELPTLDSLEQFIIDNKHLPNIPSEASIKDEGYTLHTMNTLLLEKIEELTLYTIQQQKEIQEQKEELELFKAAEKHLKHLEQKEESELFKTVEKRLKRLEQLITN